MPLSVKDAIALGFVGMVLFLRLYLPKTADNKISSDVFAISWKKE